LFALWGSIGQIYILSPDLARFVSDETPRNSSPRWLEEDIYVSSMLFRYPEPPTTIFLQSGHEFVHHPVKVQHEKKWHQIWAKEVAQMESNKKAMSAGLASADADKLVQ
jgi:hypothetical protein